jgi:ABC-type amino acid transport substrate-binding protein
MTVLYDKELAHRIFEIAGTTPEHFKPFAFHNTDGDCVEFFVTQDDYFAERIDDYLTLYLDMDTEQIVGFVIKNIKRILERLSKQKSAMAFVIDDGRVRLRSLFVSMFANENTNLDQEKKRDLVIREYRKVVEIAEMHKLDEVKLAYV